MAAQATPSRCIYCITNAPPLDHIKPQVILELGTQAEFVPRGRLTVHAFAAEEFPSLFAEPEVTPTSLLAKRTFGEKATILHAQYHRPSAKPLPDRYSRYNDNPAIVAQSPIRGEPPADLALLDQVVRHVVRHKEAFYSSARAR
ncbi:MAG: hypothetical protein ACP5E5_03830 [Acidobacteriaceae bacterium]